MRHHVSYTPGTGLGVLALHAGIEAGTGELAHEIGRTHGCTSLVVRQAGTTLDHHRPSHHYTADRVPEMGSYLAQVRFSLSLHGHNRRTRAIYLGGRNRTEAYQLAGVLRPALPDWDLVDQLSEIPDGLRGVNPANPVNMSEAGGVQVEIPISLLGWLQNRDGTWDFHDGTVDPRLRAALLSFTRSLLLREVAPLTDGR